MQKMLRPFYFYHLLAHVPVTTATDHHADSACYNGQFYQFIIQFGRGQGSSRDCDGYRIIISKFDFYVLAEEYYCITILTKPLT